MNPLHPVSAGQTRPHPEAASRPTAVDRPGAAPPPAPQGATNPADLTPEGRRERHRRETFERLVHQRGHQLDQAAQIATDLSGTGLDAIQLDLGATPTAGTLGATGLADYSARSRNDARYRLSR